MTAAVLVVDDDGPIRRMLERTLAAEGYGVSSAGDGGAALAAIERATPDLVVLDVGLPGLDGLAVCRRLRSKGLGLPILLRAVPETLGLRIHPATVEHLTFMILGSLIVIFLIAEPNGLARLWQIAKQKLRVWPFPY